MRSFPDNIITFDVVNKIKYIISETILMSLFSFDVLESNSFVLYG